MSEASGGRTGAPVSAPMASATLDRTLRLYWVSIVGIILYFVLDAIAQSLPPHYSAIRDAESDLAVGPYGYIMGINLVNRGVLSFAFIYAFAKMLELTGAPRAPFRLGYYLFGCWGVGAIILAFFPTDVPATPISWHGAIHLAVALIAFIAGALGIFSLSRRFDEVAATKGAKGFSSILGGLSILLLLLPLSAQVLAIRVAARYYGLTERLFLASVLLWIFLVSAYVLSHKREIFRPLHTAQEPA
jgi:hypothetical membrane protein